MPVDFCISAVQVKLKRRIKNKGYKAKFYPMSNRNFRRERKCEIAKFKGSSTEWKAEVFPNYPILIVNMKASKYSPLSMLSYLCI